jgi:hypothetical protein
MQSPAPVSIDSNALPLVYHTLPTNAQAALRCTSATIGDEVHNGLYVALKQTYRRSVHGNTGTGRRVW